MHGSDKAFHKASVATLTYLSCLKFGPDFSPLCANIHAVSLIKPLQSYLLMSLLKYFTLQSAGTFLLVEFALAVLLPGIAFLPSLLLEFL